MSSHRKRDRTCLKDDIQRDGPITRRARKLANINVGTLMEEIEGTSELSRSQRHTKVVKTEYEEKLNTSSEGDEESNLDVCAICLMPRTDPTLLDNCEHSFCYICTSRWMKHAGKCPLCMKVVNSFWHNLDYPTSERPMVLVAELQAAAEAARLAERGRSLPPLDEQECIRLRIRRLQRRLRLVQEQMSRSSRVDPSSELSSANERLVNEISRLDMLKRDATTRRELISNIMFRSLVYKECLDWSSIDRNANRVPFSPEVFNANVASAAQRLRPFLDRELRVVFRSKRSNESREEYKSVRDGVVSDIILWCSEFQINSPQFTHRLRLVGVYTPYLERFQAELFEFASSMLSLEDFDSMSSYSSRELRQLLRRRNRRSQNTQEIVVLSESDSDSAVILLDDAHGYNHRNRSDDVIVLSDDNRSDDEPILVNGESNYVRDESISSNSETSSTRDFYARPACRLPIPASIDVMDVFGFTREIFPRLDEIFYPADVSNTLMSSVRGASRNERFNNASTSLENHLDSTIVLSSGDESSPSPIGVAERQRFNSNITQHVQSTSSLSSKDACPLRVDWLNPSYVEGQSNSQEYKEYLMSSNDSMSQHRIGVTSPQPSTSKCLLSSREEMFVENPIKPTGEEDGLMALGNKTSLSDSANAIPSVSCLLEKRSVHCGAANYIGSHACYDSSEYSVRAEPAKSCVTTECNISTNSKLTRTTSCESTVAAQKSLFQPLTKVIHRVSYENKGKNKLLATLWKERQRRLATNRPSEDVLYQSSLGEQQSSVAEQRNEHRDKTQELPKETAVHDSEQQNLSTPKNNSVLDETVVAPVVHVTSWNSSDLVDIPSSSKCVQDIAPAGGIQTSGDLNASVQDSTLSKSNDSTKRKKRKHKHYSWKFLFKHFHRKLRHERSHRKRKRLYDFLEEMKEKLDKEKNNDETSARHRKGHSKKDLSRASSPSSVK